MRIKNFSTGIDIGLWSFSQNAIVVSRSGPNNVRVTTAGANSTIIDEDWRNFTNSIGSTYATREAVISDLESSFVVPGGGGSGSSTWGGITGTISNQADLQAALNAKQNSLGYTAENVANKAVNYSTVSDTLYPTLQATDNRYLKLSGGTLTSFLTLNADATSALHAVTFQQLQSYVTGLWDDRGNYDASVNTFPASGGSGTAGAILKGDIWTITVAGTLGGTAVKIGDLVRALADSPGQTAGNWSLTQGDLGYTALSNTLTSAKIFVGNVSNVATGVDLSGDATISNVGALTLATVNGNVGSFGSATAVGTFTVNAKGLITAAANVTITPAVGSITGLGTGVATWLATPTSANLASAVATTSTGSGSLVFGTTPTITTSIIVPLIIGGTSTTQTLTFQTSSGNSTTNSDFIWVTGNNGATERMRLLNNGTLLIGATSALLAGDTVNFFKNQNALTGNWTLNNTSGTAAQTGVFASSDNGTTNIGLRTYSAGFSTSGIGAASTAVLSTNMTGGLNVGTTSNTHLFFYTNNTQKGVWLSTGQLGIGMTPTSWLSIQAGTTAIGSILLTTGTLRTTAVAGDLEYATPTLSFTNGGAQRQEIPLIQQTRVTTQFDKTNDAALANITGLTATLVAGKIYRFEAKLHVTNNVTGGGQFAIAGTATATSITYEVIMVDNTSNLNTITSRQTALAGAIGQAGTTSGYVTIEGLIVCNAAGTLTVQFAQNTATAATTSSVLVGSTFETKQIA